eukprot:scaffold95928_cov62-Phaeocystis_antarctica.AAC.2
MRTLCCAAPAFIARSASASAASNSCSPELAGAVDEEACPLPSSGPFVHRARASAAVEAEKPQSQVD